MELGKYYIILIKLTTAWRPNTEAVVLLRSSSEVVGLIPAIGKCLSDEHVEAVFETFL